MAVKAENPAGRNGLEAQANDKRHSQPFLCQSPALEIARLRRLIDHYRERLAKAHNQPSLEERERIKTEALAKRERIRTEEAEKRKRKYPLATIKEGTFTVPQVSFDFSED